MPAAWRCPVCRSRRATLQSLVAHQEAAGHRGPCDCGGYPYPHRPGSPCCSLHPAAPYHQAAYRGATAVELDDILAGMAWDTPGKPGADCPF